MIKSSFVVLAAAVALWSCGIAGAATVAQWHFNDNSGTTAADSSGNGHAISNVGTGFGSGYSWTAGKTGNGSAVLAAPGNTSYLYADLGTNNLGYEMTIDCWIKPTLNAPAGTRVLMSLQNSFFVRFNNDGYGIGFIVRTAQGWKEVNPWVTGTPWAYSDGTWHRLVMVYNGNAGHVRLYWDGELKAISTFDVSSGPLKMGAGDPVGPNFYIGTSAWDPMAANVNYEGGVDEVTISNTDLYPIPDTKIVAQYHMEDGSGTTITDSSFWANNLTINSPTVWNWTTGYTGTGLQMPDNSAGFSNCLLNLMAPSISRQVTVEAWIKPTAMDPTNGNNIIGQGWAWSLSLSPNNDLRWLIASHNVNDANTTSSYNQWLDIRYGPAITSGPDIGRLVDGNWHHIAGVFDGMADSQGKSHLKLYVDFTLIYDLPINYPSALGFTWQPPTRKLSLGAGWYADDGPFWGYMDEVRVDAAVRTKFGCGADGYLAGDVNQDCEVDFADFAAMTANWLKCNNPFNAACN